VVYHTYSALKSDCHYYYLLVMCSCSTKERVCLVIGRQGQRKRWAEEEAVAEVTGKGYGSPA